MALFGNFFHKLKNVFGGELIGTAAGTVSGKMISELIGMPAKKITEFALDKMFQVPPRAELQKVLLGLNPTQRKFWEDRLEEAKNPPPTRPDLPSENEVVTAWCKPLLLKKIKVLLKKNDGEPILNNGAPVYAENESELVSDDDLRQHIYGKVADIGEKEFWIWTDLLIHDKWGQIFKIWGKKFIDPIKKHLLKRKDQIDKYLDDINSDYNKRSPEVTNEVNDIRQQIKNRNLNF